MKNNEPEYDYGGRWGWKHARRQGIRQPHRSNQRRCLDRLITLGYQVKELTPYQYRINETLDLFITNNKYHDLKNNERGEYTRIDDIVKQKCERIIK